MTKKTNKQISYTKIEIITLFMLIILTVASFLIFSGAIRYNNFMLALNNVLLIMIFGILLTINMMLIKIRDLLYK